MNPRYVTSCCVVALLLLPQSVRAADAISPDAATAQTPPQTQTEIVKDAAMTARIEARLADETMADLAQVKVAADRNGNVVLGGKVKTQAEEEKAVSIVRDTEGVKVVRSTIQIIKGD